MSFKDAVLTIFVAAFILWSGYSRAGDVEGLFGAWTMECADAKGAPSPESRERAPKAFSGGSGL